MINEQEQIWNFANFVEKMEGVRVGKWVENDVVIEANCVKKLWPPHSPTHLLRGKKKKIVTISTAQLNWTPILGEAMLYSFIIFLDYLSWIKFGQVNLLIKKCDFEAFWDLGLHLSACTNLNALGTGDRVVALIFSWKLLHRSLVGGPKKHPSLFSIKTFFFFFEIYCRIRNESKTWDYMDGQLNI